MKYFLISLLLLAGVFKTALIAAQDTVMYARDSALDIPTDPTTLFFQEGEKTKTPGKVILVMRDKKVKSLSALLKSYSYDNEPSPFADYAFADLDKDGKKELLIYNYTGGAHCCDEIIVFRNTGINRFQHAGRMIGGNTIIEKGGFTFHFTEPFGYFFTCFACEYEDASLIENFSIRLRYANGRIKTVAGDSAYRNLIIKNLKSLGSKPYQPLEEDIEQDDGWRKEIAFNLACYYYAFGKNLVNTKSLFQQYYKYPDAVNFWKQFARQISYMRQENDF